jgi:hypothetical protein
MGEIRSTFKPPRPEDPGSSEKLRVNMGRPEVKVGAEQEGYVGKKFLQRDAGETWEVFEANPVTSGPLSGETMLRLKGEKGQTFNMPQSRLEDILKEENGAWQKPPKSSL